jgi:hypothetical protein
MFIHQVTAGNEEGGDTPPSALGLSPLRTLLSVAAIVFLPREALHGLHRELPSTD